MKNKKEVKEYQDKMMSMAKGTMALGTLNTIGTYAFARVGSNHPATAPVANATVAGLQLTQVGQLANVGMNIIPIETAKKETKKKDTDAQKRVNKILGK